MNLRLIQVKNDKQLIHGVSDNVSELIQFYYDNRKQHGYMEVLDENDKTIVTFGSDINLTA